jgi:uncharacterized protein involved in outer membrane biogenesis
MSVIRGLLAVVAAAVVLLALLVVAWLTLDLGFLGKPLAGWAGGQLGRALAIDGPVSIRGGRSLRFSAEGIRLANPAWGARPDMLAVARLVIEVDAASLLSRPVIIRRVEVDGLDLLLERRADGSSNWEFAGPAPDDGPAWPERLPVVVERVSAPGARIGFAGPRLARPLDLRFDTLEQQRAADGMLALSARGTANGEALVFDARVGTFAALLTARDLRGSLAGRIGELAVDLELAIDDLVRPAATRLVLKVRGPGADYLTTRFGIRNLGAGPLAVDGVIRPAADGEGVEADLTGEVGEFTFKARGLVVDPGEMRKLRLGLDLSGPDLSFAGGLTGINGLPVVPFRLTAAVERAGEVVRIDDATLSLADGQAQLSGTINRFTSLAGNDLQFQWSGSDLGLFRDWLGLPAAFTGAFDVAGELKATGDEELLDLKVTTNLGVFKATGPLGVPPDYFGTRLDLTVSGPSLARVGQLAGVAGLPGDAYTAAGNLEWTATGAVIRAGTLQAARTRLALDGRVARDPLGPGTDLNWSVGGPDLRALAGLLPIEGLPGAAFDLRGRLRREAGASRLDGVQGTVAGAALRLAGRIGDQPRSGTTLDLSMAGPQLEAFAGLVPGYQLPAGPFSIDGGITLAPARVILRDMRLAAAGAEGAVDADIELPLSAVRGTFAGAASGPDVARFLPRLGTVPPPVVPFKLRVRGQARGGTWRLDAAELDTAAVRLNASGTLDWAPDFSATALTLSMTAPDLAAAGRLLGTTLPARDFELVAAVTGTPAAFTAERVRGRLGTTDFDGRLAVKVAERPVIDVDFRSDLLDLTPFVGTPAAALPAVEPAPRTQRAKRKGAAQLIPDTAIPLGWLNRVDGSLAIRATRALVLGVALDDMTLAARLKGGSLSVESLELKAPPDGRLGISGRVTPDGPRARMQLAATGTRVVLGRLDETRAQRAGRPRVDLDLEVAGAGRTWRELAQSLDGRLRLTGGPGEVPAASINRLFGNLWRDIAATMAPGFAPRDTLPLRCVAAFVTATDGVVQTAPALVMQTEKLNVIAHGTVDLGSEQLEAYLSTAPRRGRADVSVAEIVNPYVKLTGTLADPRLGLDPKGALFSGGAAVATVGISILAKGVWDRMFQAEDPCAAAAAEAERLASGAPARGKRLLPRLRRGQ